MNQGEVFRYNGLYAEASESFNRGISESRDLGVERWTAALLGNGADIEMLTGRWDDAIDLLDEAPDHPALDFPELTIIGKRMLIAAERGNDEIFDATAARLAGYDIANQEPQVNAAIWIATISRLRWRGDLQAAYDLASVALDNHKDIDPWSETAPLAALALEVVADAETEKLARDSWIGRARGARAGRSSKHQVARRCTPRRCGSRSATTPHHDRQCRCSHRSCIVEVCIRVLSYAGTDRVAPCTI